MIQNTDGTTVNLIDNNGRLGVPNPNCILYEKTDSNNIAVGTIVWNVPLTDTAWQYIYWFVYLLPKSWMIMKYSG